MLGEGVGNHHGLRQDEWNALPATKQHKLSRSCGVAPARGRRLRGRSDALEIGTALCNGRWG